MVAIVAIHDLPDYVKSASQEAVCGDDTTPSRLFALPRSRQLPCHTKAATWTSLAYFANAGHLLDPEDAIKAASALAAAAEFWDLVAPAQELAQTALHAIKTAAAPRPEPAPEDYAWTRTRPDGVTERHCPVRDAVEAKSAAAWVLTYQDRFAPADRRALAAGVLTRAEAVGADLGDAAEALEKAAGMGTCPHEGVVQLLRDRATLVAERYPWRAEELSKMASVVRSLPGVDPGTDLLHLLDDQVRALDRETGLDLRYDRDVARPQETLFAVTEKAAQTFTRCHVELPGGDVYRRDDLARLPADALTARLGSKVAAAACPVGLFVEPEPLVEALAALGPAALADFRKLAAEHGLKPVATGAQSVIPTRADLVSLVTA